MFLVALNIQNISPEGRAKAFPAPQSSQLFLPTFFPPPRLSPRCVGCSPFLEKHNKEWVKDIIITWSKIPTTLSYGPVGKTSGKGLSLNDIRKVGFATETEWRKTLLLPEDSPKMVTWPGSPPKALMFSRTQDNAMF